MNKHGHSQGFFETLGALAGSRQRENQLSRTFKACFDHSQVFRTRVLALLARTCDLKLSPHAEWECDAEVGHRSGGRMDMVLRSPGQPRLILESKVESVLALAQLKRYGPNRSRGHHLVAVTKYRPEVPRRELRRAAIRSIRWQDVHRALTNAPVTGGVDRFVAEAFTGYLEGQEMAYRSTLSPMNLKRAGALLAVCAAQSPNTRALSASRAFGALDSLAQLLLDLTFDARDEFPQFAKWSRRGPFYSRSDGQPTLHAGLRHGRRKSADYRDVSWGFSIGKGGALRFSVWSTSGANGRPEESRPVAVTTMMSRGGVLDHDGVWGVLREEIRSRRARLTR